jgi:hypothetical protein
MGLKPGCKTEMCRYDNAVFRNTTRDVGQASNRAAVTGLSARSGATGCCSCISVADENWDVRRLAFLQLSCVRQTSDVTLLIASPSCVLTLRTLAVCSFKKNLAWKWISTLECLPSQFILTFFPPPLPHQLQFLFFHLFVPRLFFLLF